MLCVSVCSQCLCVYESLSWLVEGEHSQKSIRENIRRAISIIAGCQGVANISTAEDRSLMLSSPGAGRHKNAEKLRFFAGSKTPFDVVDDGHQIGDRVDHVVRTAVGEDAVRVGDTLLDLRLVAGSQLLFLERCIVSLQQPQTLISALAASSSTFQSAIACKVLFIDSALFPRYLSQSQYAR